MSPLSMEMETSVWVRENGCEGHWSMTTNSLREIISTSARHHETAAAAIMDVNYVAVVISFII